MRNYKIPNRVFYVEETPVPTIMKDNRNFQHFAQQQKDRLLFNEKYGSPLNAPSNHSSSNHSSSVLYKLGIGAFIILMAIIITITVILTVKPQLILNFTNDKKDLEKVLL